MALQPLMTDSTGQAIVSQLQRMTSGETAINEERSRAQGEEQRLEGLIQTNTNAIIKAYVSGTAIGQPTGDYAGTVQQFRDLNPKKSYLVWKNAFQHFPDVDTELKSVLTNQSYWYLEPCFAIGEAETYEALSNNPYVILHSPSNTVICEWRSSTTLRLKYELANASDVSNNTQNISTLTSTITTDALKAGDVSVGTPSGEYTGAFNKFGDLRPNNVYLIWKNAIDAFADIDQGIKNYENGYYTVVPLLYSYGKNAYSEINIRTTVLLVSYRDILLCNWTGATSGALTYITNLNNTADVTTLTNSLNYLSDIAYQSATNWIGSPTGDYSGDVNSFGELNPNRCYVIWKNAIDTFPDIANSVKDLNNAYLIVWCINYTRATTYSQIRIQTPVLLVFGRKIYLASWYNGTATLYGPIELANWNDLTDDNGTLNTYGVGVGDAIGSPNGEYTPTTYTKFGDLSPNKRYIIWKNALTYFNDIDEQIKDIFNGFAIVVPFEYEKNKARYSQQNTTVPVLMFAYGNAVLADWSNGENGALHYRFTIKNYDSNINSLTTTLANVSETYMHSIERQIGSPSGDYTGNITAFSELNPHAIYLVWKNAIDTFPDVTTEIKNLNKGYYIIVPCSPLNKKTYAETGLDNHILGFVAGFCYHFQWQNQQLIYRGTFAKTSDIENLQTTVQQNTIKIATSETAIANITKKANNTKNLMLVAPSGNKYVVIVDDTGQLVSVPVVPRKISFIGNSLLAGMDSQFGMAASASNKDYRYIITSHCNATSIKIAGSAFENAGTVETGRNAADTIFNQLDVDSDLVIIQLGDNSSTTELREIMIANIPYLLTGIRNKCPHARVVWAGSWYGQSNITRVFNVVNSLGYEYIDFTTAHTSANENRIGAKYTLDTAITIGYNVDSWSVSGNDVTITFTVNGTQYTQTVTCDSYTSTGGVQVSITGREQVITQSGVASHPNDAGFAEIANIMMESLSIT